MLNLLTHTLFCTSVSMDGFTIGCSYGLRNFKCSFITNIIIFTVATCFSAIATFCGGVIIQFLPRNFATYAGTIFLMGLGIYTIINGFFKKAENPQQRKKISVQESLYLSLAVSIDAFSGTLAYTLSNDVNIFIPLGVGLFHSLFFLVGIVLSRKTVYGLHLPKWLLTTFSGLLIVFVAISKLFL